MRENKKVWILIGSFLIFLVGYNVFTNVYAEKQDEEKDIGYNLVHSLGHELIRIDYIFTQIIEANELTSDLATQLIHSSEQIQYHTRMISLYLGIESNGFVTMSLHSLISFAHKLANEASTESIQLNSSQAEALKMLRQEISSLTLELEPAKTLEAELDSTYHPKEALQEYLKQLENNTHWRYMDGTTISHPLIEN